MLNSEAVCKLVLLEQPSSPAADRVCVFPAFSDRQKSSFILSIMLQYDHGEDVVVFVQFIFSLRIMHHSTLLILFAVIICTDCM